MANNQKYIEESAFTGQATSLAGASATYTPINVEGFSRIGFQFTGVSALNGRGTFSVAGTIDGTNWNGINTLIDNVTNSNSQDLTRVASKAITSLATSAIVWIENNPFKAVRVGVNIAHTGNRTDVGSYSATVIAIN